MADYIPGPDADFTIWLKTFLLALQARQETLNVLDPELEALSQSSLEWDRAIAAHNAAQAAAATATSHKQLTRDRLEELVRAAVRRVQTHAAIQDSDRRALGINIPSGRTQAPAPTTHPLPQVNTSQRLRHTIHFTDELTPNSRAKPAGVRGCEIWGKVSDAPITDPAQLNFLGLSTATPHVVEYTGADAGKIAHYMLRWVNARGEKGPWSQTVSATVTA